jgi:hypothetical protein
MLTYAQLTGPFLVTHERLASARRRFNKARGPRGLIPSLGRHYLSAIGKGYKQSCRRDIEDDTGTRGRRSLISHPPAFLAKSRALRHQVVVVDDPDPAPVAEFRERVTRRLFVEERFDGCAGRLDRNCPRETASTRYDKPNCCCLLKVCGVHVSFRAD